MNVSRRLYSLFRERRPNLTTSTVRYASRVFAISDIHVDIRENLKFEESWSDDKYKEDVLIIAGDITDHLPLLKSTLQDIQAKFQKVFYVPGNHELWIRDSCTDSIEKFHRILEMCAEIGVHTDPVKIHTDPDDSGASDVWIVPLFSWYAKPEEDSEDSLYESGPRYLHEDRKFCEQGWMDNRLCKWDSLPNGFTPSKYFSALNSDRVAKTYDAPVISFSHFIPRLELLHEDDATDHVEVKRFRDRHYMGEAPKFQGGVVGFNFSRYAGCKRLEQAIRRLGSRVHIHGHQHRNRDREVEGVRYVSHCLGSVQEQEEGWTWGLEEWKGPKQIWPEKSAKEREVL